jgi:hypothetical protein
MMKKSGPIVAICMCTTLMSCGRGQNKSVTAPITLDHNRMLVNAEIQRKDGTWRPVLLWIDTGNPDFMISPSLARDLGIDLSAAEDSTGKISARSLDVSPPDSVRIGDLPLNFTDVNSAVLFEPSWLFNTVHCEANLPSTVLRHYQVVFDYPRKELTLAEPGALSPRGVKVPASVDTPTGIVQIDATIDGSSYSFALDNGASYSFVSDTVLRNLMDDHATWPRTTGAVGCANIWGWWPQEPAWPMVRVPEIDWSGAKLKDIVLVGLPDFFGGHSLGEWYSQKTARRVDGFLGPNAFKAFRIQIDFQDDAVYFEQGAEFDAQDLDIVGLTLQPQRDSGYLVIGVAEKDGKTTAPGIQPGDILVQIGDLKIKGATMGTVVDALRGAPGDVRTLTLERDGKQFTTQATVEHFL